MASSNKHWPSMFKSKPSTTTHLHQWQHDLSSSHRNPYSPGPGCEERTPEPKPRWNPRPEQIRILESIFNSGMVNPPRDEIRKIRAQLQEYGQVGDANVFYWFQNRKSRSKHKQRQMLQHDKSQNTPPPPITTTISAVTPPSSSSSSSDKSSPNNHLSSANVIDLLNSPTGSVNQPYFQNSSEFLTEPYFFPVLQGNNHGGAGEFCFPECVSDQTAGNNCPSVLLGELMLMSNGPAKKDDVVDDGKMKMQQQIGYGGAGAGAGAPNSGDHLLPPSLSINQLLQGAGLGESGPPKSTVFINDVCFEVASGPFNVRDAFGDDAVLIQSSGHPVVTNEWGVTLQPLQQGAFYYLVRAFSPSANERTIDLI